MAKHRFQTIRKTRATPLMISAALVCGLGVLPAWAGQHFIRNTPPSGPAGQTTGQPPAQPPAPTTGQTSAPTPDVSAKTPSHGKGTTTSPALADGRRDPFKLPEFVAPKTGGAESTPNSSGNGVLPPGVRGLLIPHLVVEGVVREQASNKMIAVVTNESRRAYFLHENDSVYDGVVSKITPDTVYFKENVLDADGRVTTREVAKRLGAAPGEGR